MPARPSRSPSVSAFILRVRALAKEVAETYYKTREALGFPMLNPSAAASRKHAA